MSLFYDELWVVSRVFIFVDGEGREVVVRVHNL